MYQVSHIGTQKADGVQHIVSVKVKVFCGDSWSQRVPLAACVRGRFLYSGQIGLLHVFELRSHVSGLTDIEKRAMQDVTTLRVWRLICRRFTGCGLTSCAVFPNFEAGNGLSHRQGVEPAGRTLEHAALSRHTKRDTIRGSPL